MPRRKTPTAAQRKYFSLAAEEHDLIEKDFARMRIPDEWHEIWRMRVDDPEDRQEITFEVDKDVIKFFKSMGSNYGPRMNRVLRAFMLDRLAGVVTGPEARALPDAQAKLEALQSELDQLQKDDATGNQDDG